MTKKLHSPELTRVMLSQRKIPEPLRHTCTLLSLNCYIQCRSVPWHIFFSPCVLLLLKVSFLTRTDDDVSNKPMQCCQGPNKRLEAIDCLLSCPISFVLWSSCYQALHRQHTREDSRQNGPNDRPWDSQGDKSTKC